nr:zinc finger CCCH domain-containing protein 15 [Tanacetum cinerariifolium]GEV98296.1 zinc finger CCCH domain-containing protein 15 [Tanacetum cinerariifolium]GEV98302.1 zinc finger CCCH domain-containing protein 15 [Tanacetum cinerariifolium]
MKSYSNFPYTGAEDDSKLWSRSTLINQTDCGAYDYEAPLYSSIFPATTPPRHYTVTPNTTTLPLPLVPPPLPMVADYSRRHSLDFAPLQDLIERRNWCLENLRLTAKEAEALRQENVNLQMANSELNKQLSNLQQKAASVSATASASVSGSASGSSMQKYANASVFQSVNSVTDCFGRMRIGDKRSSVIDKRAARGVENVDPVKKLDVERVKLPKSISVRSNGYMKGAQAGDGSVSRARAVDRVKTASDSQKVFVRGKKEEEPLELKVYNQGMTKTELCNKWQQTGACPYGDHCQFAHGIEELRPVIRHPRYKTEVCRMVLAGDPCPYGHRCHFRHALTEEEKLMSRRINN